MTWREIIKVIDSFEPETPTAIICDKLSDLGCSEKIVADLRKRNDLFCLAFYVRHEVMMDHILSSLGIPKELLANVP